MAGRVFTHPKERGSTELLDRSEDVLATFALRETAPNTVGLLDLERCMKALLTHGAHLADRSRSLLSPFSFVLALECAWWKKEV